ncbi:uncharacterized transmembrane protein DDB_G0289901-like [Bicyclus anynana]|uniref:Uncharacterized transmembrane protein DDB_G0289901-like n=1 Tax=Bicyclus anynana TaxID=110368 RepID=A0ABM3M142_BICAN|nr:uncharacterized transmembrane protein DDB_G0289901-like [Bicyclus anynana]XP_052745052.1 uncharacterized transmembrane protein DDB_G0289901-like [Bicyclus anynana]
MSKYVVSSQPRTTAKNNSTEPPLSEVRYDTIKCEECRNDNDQCCFVYFYSLYCGRYRCSGCCDDEKKKRSRPLRIAANNYTVDDVSEDDNITSFIKDDTVYRPTTYSDYNIVHEHSGGVNRGDLAVAGIDYDGHLSGRSRNDHHTGDMSRSTCKPDAGNSGKVHQPGLHSDSANDSETVCYPYGQSVGHASKSHSVNHSSVEDKFGNVCYTVGNNASGDHSSKSHSVDHSGVENKYGNVCYTVGNTGSGDHGVSHSGGTVGHGGHSVADNTHSSSGDHSGGNHGSVDHSSGWGCSGGDTGGDSGGGGGGDTGGDSGGGGGGDSGGGDTGGDSGGGGGGGDD